MSYETVIRRAGPRDVDALVAFINQSQPDHLPVDRVQVLQSFGEHGYMVAEVDGQIQALIGWHAEDFIARIRQVTILPTGRDVALLLLEAVCQSAHDLMCEVALLFPPLGAPDKLLSLYQACDFAEAALGDLIPAWRRAAEQSMPADTFVMTRKLREKRVMRPV